MQHYLNLRNYCIYATPRVVTSWLTSIVFQLWSVRHSSNNNCVLSSSNVIVKTIPRHVAWYSCGFFFITHSISAESVIRGGTRVVITRNNANYLDCSCTSNTIYSFLKPFRPILYELYVTFNRELIYLTHRFNLD